MTSTTRAGRARARADRAAPRVTPDRRSRRTSCCWWPSSGVLVTIGVVMVLSASSVLSLTSYGTPGTSSTGSSIWTALGVDRLRRRRADRLPPLAARGPPARRRQRRAAGRSCSSPRSACTSAARGGGSASDRGASSRASSPSSRCSCSRPTSLTRRVEELARLAQGPPTGARGPALLRCARVPRARPRLDRAAGCHRRRGALRRRHPRPPPRGDRWQRDRARRCSSRSPRRTAGPVCSRSSPDRRRIEHRLPDRAVAHRARERRRRRRRARRRPGEVALPPERAHRLHLRGHRRGARAHRRVDSCWACSSRSPSSASRTALRAPDRFGMLVATGVTVWIVGQAAVNIGGVVGLLPVSGIPLPFVSFGGSALVITCSRRGSSRTSRGRAR